MKSGLGLLTRDGRLEEVPNKVILLGNVWYFGNLVAAERWSQLGVRLFYMRLSSMQLICSGRKIILVFINNLFVRCSERFLLYV